MAKIGSFGELAFSVSDQTVRTFDSMSWNVSGKYSTHDRHLKSDLQEFLGPEPEDISFSMKFSVFLGVNPLTEIERLRSYVKTGRTERLIIGGRVYGDYKWVIQKISAELPRFDGKGNLWEAQVKVTLKEYPKR